MIAGGGFAMMAWKLAWRREHGIRPMTPAPMAREVSAQVSARYYHIIDNAWANFKTFPRNGMTVHL